MTPTHAEQRRLLHAAGLLDPPDALEMEEREGLAPGPRPALSPTPAAWRVPPPGFGLPAAVRAPAALRGRARPEPGDTVEVVLPPLPDADARQVVLLAQRGGRWSVVTPRGPDELHRLDRSTRRGEDGLVLELVMPARGGRWAVALPPVDLQVDWSTAGPRRWATLRQGLERGEVPIASVVVGGPSR